MEPLPLKVTELSGLVVAESHRVGDGTDWGPKVVEKSSDLPPLTPKVLSWVAMSAGIVTVEVKESSPVGHGEAGRGGRGQESRRSC